MVRQLVKDLVDGDEVCDSEMNGCSNVTGEVMHRSVRYAVGDGESRSGDVNE